MRKLGEIQSVAGGIVRGWIADPALVVGAPAVSLFLDDEFLLTVRPADLGPGPQNRVGSYSFQIKLWEDVMQRSGRLEVRSGTRTGAQIAFNTRMDTDSFAGEVRADGGRLVGWAVNLDRPDSQVTLDIHLGVRWIGAARTLNRDPYVQADFGTSQLVGFEFGIPAYLRSRSHRVFRVFFANTDIELNGSPVVSSEDDRRPALEDLQRIVPAMPLDEHDV